jgi:N-acetylglucosaminyldiphosphoundecaprenol N-acetyl-beta-D-mannosaminyltransferase
VKTFSKQNRKRIYVGRAPVDSIDLDELLQKFSEIIEDRSNHYGCFCEAHLCVLATVERGISDILENASFVLPDGVAMTLGAKLLGKKLFKRLPGPYVMLKTCEFGVKHGWRHFLYGGAESIAEKLADKLSERFPGFKVAGTYCPPFRALTEQQDSKIVEMINKTNPDIIWVGLGAPKQEKWMAEHLGKLSAPLMLGVGAAFDFHSGNKKWAPVWVRKVGLEWLYRMFTGGKRVFIRNARYDSLMAYILFRQAIANGINFCRTKKCKR